jgi:hypothetical protein
MGQKCNLKSLKDSIKIRQRLFLIHSHVCGYGYFGEIFFSHQTPLTSPHLSFPFFLPFLIFFISPSFSRIQPTLSFLFLILSFLLLSSPLCSSTISLSLLFHFSSSLQLTHTHTPMRSRET